MIYYIKEYNDFYGHFKEDECLRKVGALFKAFADKNDGFAMRFGGEEFVLIFPDHDEPSVSNLADTLRRNMEKLKIPHEKSSVSDYLTISIGQYCNILSIDKQTDFMVYLDKADSALYQAKQSGRNRIVSYQEN